MTRKRFLWCVLSGVCVAGLIVAAAPSRAGSAGPEASLLATGREGIELELRPSDGKAGTFEVRLHDLDGKLLAEASGRHRGKPFQVRIRAPVDAGDLANYYLRYRFHPREGFRQSGGCPLPCPSAARRRRSDMQQPSHERARGEHDGRGAVHGAVLRPHAARPVAFHEDLVDHLLPQRQSHRSTMKRKQRALTESRRSKF